jgi:DnaJ family protein C protein 11
VQVAQRMFPKLQKAYSVLSDPRQRDIYDLYGHAGLEAGSEVRVTGGIPWREVEGGRR